MNPQMSHQVDGVAGLFSRWVPEAIVDPAVAAAARMREAVELAALAEADRVARVAARISDQVHMCAHTFAISLYRSVTVHFPPAPMSPPRPH